MVYKNLSYVWLADFRPPSSRGMSGQGCPAKKISTLAEQEASLCDPPHPPGDKACPTFLVPAVSQAPWLSAPTLLDGNSFLAFQAPQWLPCRRQRKSFAPNLTPFSKIQTYINTLGNCYCLQKQQNAFTISHSACIINVWSYMEILTIHLSQSALYYYSTVHKYLQCHSRLQALGLLGNSWDCPRLPGPDHCLHSINPVACSLRS